MVKLYKKISGALRLSFASLKNKLIQFSYKLFLITKALLEKLLARLLRRNQVILKTSTTALILALIVSLLGLTTFRFIHGKIDDINAKKMRMRPVSVVVKPVTLGDITVTQTALGTVVPRNVVTVHTQVDGVLSQVFFKEGQEVKVGQLLALIDPRPFAAAVKQAEGTMKRDKMLLENAQLDLKRYKTLLSQDSVSSQVYDTQKALVQQYTGTVLTDEGLLDSAKLQLSYTKIVSPIAGRIGLRLVDPGNVVHASDANGLFVITQTKPITVVYSIPQDSLPSYTKIFQVTNPNLASINSPSEANHRSEKKSRDKPKTEDKLNNVTENKSAKVDVEIWNSNSKIKLSTGILDSIDNQIDLTTGTIKLKAIFDNEDNNLFPNQFVNVKTILETRKNVVVMPASAIQLGTPGTFVYRLNSEQKTVSVVPIKVGPQDNNMVQVEEGLEPGDQIVVDGMDKLRNGARVEIGLAPENRRGNRKGAWNDKNSPANSATSQNTSSSDQTITTIEAPASNSTDTSRTKSNKIPPANDKTSTHSTTVNKSDNLDKDGHELTSDQITRREAWRKKKNSEKAE